MRWLPELLLVLSTAGAGQTDRPVGQVLATAPSVPPGTVAPAPANPLALARERAHEGDWAGVAAVLTPWVEAKKGPTGRERASANLLLGLAHLELANWNLASAAFTRVRSSGGPLAPYGAWYQAVVDHKRGRDLAAAATCKDYRTQWPNGPLADNCLLLIGDAFSAAGQRGSSLAAYQQYLERHPDTPHEEEIRLGVALATAATNPEQAVPMLQELVISHSWHSTALAAQAELDELAAKGMTVALPTDPRTRQRQCESARRCGQLDEAWGLFQQLASEAERDPEIATWVDNNEDRIAWGTRQYDVFAKKLEADYAKKPDGELAWRIFGAWTKEGDWEQAVTWSRKAKAAHPTSSRWKRASVEVAWAETLAGHYAEGRALWQELAKAGGKNGLDAKFYAAFCAYRAGDKAAAEAELSALASRDTEWSTAALYWRSKARAEAGDAPGSAADAAAVSARDRHGWYRLLLEQADPAPTGPGWVVHDGTWHGTEARKLTAGKAAEVRPLPAVGIFAAALPAATDPASLASAGGLEIPASTEPSWGALRWPLPSPAPTATDAAPAVPTLPLPELPLAVPDGYQACLWYDPVAARKAFATFSEAQKGLWPDLPAANDLALAGDYEEASRLLTVVYTEWDKAWDGVGDPVRVAQLRAVNIKVEDWRPFFLFVRNDYQSARFCATLDRTATTEADREAARRLAYPIVRGADLWSYGRDFDIDPLLMMGIMRQESTYQPWARSVSNAIGLVQILPSTGAKVAALLGEQRYSPGDLEIPSINVRFGSYYFSLLMRRFDDVFPLAVASYNGGPHNVSRWYHGWHGKIPLDVFVEQIPFAESRDYVKRVSGHYAEYVDLYGAEGATVRLPATPAGDDASVVDF